MNWKKEAVNQLKEYHSRRDSMVNLITRCKQLEKEVKRCENLPIPTNGKLSEEQEQLLNHRSELKQLKANYAMASCQLRWIEQGLAALSDDERMVLEGFYVEEAGPFTKSDLMDKLCIERSALYTMKDRALRKFTLSMYGMLES